MSRISTLAILLCFFVTKGMSQWEPQSSGTNNNLEGVYFVNDTVGWAVGENGTVIYTSDGGENWMPRSIGTTSKLWDVHFISSTEGWVSGATDTIFHTTDGGVTWDPQPTGTGANFRCVHFNDNSNGWAGGHPVIHTTNGGSSWNVQQTGSGWIEALHFSDNSNGWASGELGNHYRTNDGGTSWNSKSFPGSWASSIHMLDASRAWMVDLEIYYTNDSGNTYVTQSTPLNTNFYDIHFKDSLNGVAVGYDENIVRTFDGGSNWVVQSNGTSSQPTLNGVHMTQTYAWAVGDNGVIYKYCPSSTSSITENACNSYTVPSGDTTYTSSGMYEDTLENSIGCDSIISIDLTVNTVDTTVNPVDPTTLEAVANGASYQWLDCDNGYTVISGETYKQFTASSNGNYAVEVSKNGCTDTSSCYEITDAGTGIAENDLNTNISFHPNPTDDGVTFEIPGRNESLQVTVRDMNGKKVLERKVKHPSSFKVALGEKSGIYIVRLQDNDGKDAVIRVVKE